MQVQAPGGLFLEERFKGAFLRYWIGGLYLEGLIHGGAYTWKRSLGPPEQGQQGEGGLGERSFKPYQNNEHESITKDGH